MMILLFRQIRRVLRKHSWLNVVLALMLLHIISVVLFLVFDYETFAGATVIDTLWNGTWWFFTTATTVGYGDVVPKTMVGQIIAVFDMIFGIGLMFAFIGIGVEGFITYRGKKMKGLKQLKLNNHIVILGGGAFNRLKAIVKGLKSDPKYKHTDIVICSDAYEENPMLHVIEFVKGKMDSDDVLERACVKDADVIIIYGYTDEQTILSAMAADDINRDALTSVYIRDRNNVKHITRINKLRQIAAGDSPEKKMNRIRVITRLNDLMLAREASNPDIAAAILELMLPGKGNTFYSIQAWPQMTMCLKLPMVRRFLLEADDHALLIGFKRHENGELVLNPDEDTFICPQDHIFVIAAKRPYIDWEHCLKISEAK